MSEVTPAGPGPAAPPALPDWFGTGLDSWALDATLKSLTGDREETRAKLRTEIVSIAKQAAGPSPTALEWMLTTTLAMAWVAVRHREVFLYNEQGQPSLRQIEHRARMLDRAVARFNAVARTLAAVRRAGAPAVQVVNLGGQNQTNVLATGAAGST